MQRANVTATTNCCIEHPTRWCPLGTCVKDKIHVETIFAVEEERTLAAQ